MALKIARAKYRMLAPISNQSRLGVLADTEAPNILLPAEESTNIHRFDPIPHNSRNGHHYNKNHWEGHEFHSCPSQLI